MLEERLEHTDVERNILDLIRCRHLHSKQARKLEISTIFDLSMLCEGFNGLFCHIYPEIGT